MRTFITINKGKIRFMTTVIVIAAALMYLPCYFLPLADKPSLFILLSVHLLLIFCVTMFLLMVTLLSGYVYYRGQLHLFERTPLNEFLKKYNFQAAFINTGNKWRLTQQIKYGHVESYPVVLFKSRRSGNTPTG